MNLKSIVNSIQALNELSSLPLKANVSFSLKKVLKAAQANAELHQEQYKAVLERYGTPQDGGSYIVAPENHKALMDELVALDVVEVDMPTFKMKLSDLSKTVNGQVEWYDVKPATLVALDWMIEE